MDIDQWLHQNLHSGDREFDLNMEIDSEIDVSEYGFRLRNVDLWRRENSIIENNLSNLYMYIYTSLSIYPSTPVSVHVSICIYMDEDYHLDISTSQSMYRSFL